MVPLKGLSLGIPELLIVLLLAAMLCAVGVLEMRAGSGARKGWRFWVGLVVTVGSVGMALYAALGLLILSTITGP